MLGVAVIVVAALSACAPDPAPPEPSVPPVKVFDSSPTPVAPSYVSIGYQAEQTREFGDRVQLAGTARKLTSAKVTLVTWAYQSNWMTSSFCTAPGTSCTATGWTHPVRLNIYASNNSTAVPATGALLGSVLTQATIPWRPEPTPALCPGFPTTWAGDDSVCRNGYTVEVSIDLTAANITAPDEIIYGIEYATGNYGATPLVVDGPYNQLNVARGVIVPSVGLDADSTAFFQSTLTPSRYSDGGLGGVGIFRHNVKPEGPPLVEIFATA